RYTRGPQPPGRRQPRHSLGARKFAAAGAIRDPFFFRPLRVKGGFCALTGRAAFLFRGNVEMFFLSPVRREGGPWLVRRYTRTATMLMSGLPYIAYTHVPYAT